MEMPNKTKKSRSITTILAVSFFTFTLVALTISSSLLVYFNFKAQESAVSNSQKLIAQDAAKTVSSFIKEKVSVIKTAVWISDPNTFPKSEQIKLLQSFLGLQPSFRQMILSDDTNKISARVSRSSLLSSIQSELKYLNQAYISIRKNSSYLSPVYIEDVTSEPLMLIAVPINNVFGVYKGSLIAELNLKFMWDLVDNLKIGETGCAYVVDRNGTLISYGDAARVLKNENVKHLEPVAKFISGTMNNSVPNILTFNGINRTLVVGTYIPLGTPDWAVITELPWTEAYQKTITELIIAAITLVAIAIFVSIVGVYLARRLSVPIVNLMETASKIALGEKELQAEVAGPKEVASLAFAFNSMTSQLNKSYQELEEQIVEVKKAEEALRISQFSIEKSFDAIFWMNKEGKFTYINEQACNSLGYSKEELLGLYLWDIDPIYPRELWTREWDSYQVDKKGGGRNADTLHKRKDGTIFHVETSSMHTWFGDFELHVAHVRDITERKEAEAALRESQEKFSKMFYSSPVPISISRVSDGRYVDVNDAFLKLREFTREEVIGHSSLELGIWVEPNNREDMIRNLHQERTIKNYESKFRSKSGVIDTSVLYREVIELSGEEFFISTSLDVTTLKNVEQELTKAKNYITNIINSMPSLLIGVDLENNVTLWNNKAEQETGIDANQAVGKNLYEIFPRFNVKTESIKRAILEKEVQRELGIPRYSNNQVYYEDFTIFPIDANGVEGAVIRVDDKTEQKRLEEIMIQSEKMLSVGGLAAGMAHEINNPLAGILQSAEILKRRLTDSSLEANKRAANEVDLDFSKLEKYLNNRDLIQLMDNIRKSGGRASEIVKNMLSFARKSDHSFSVYDIAKLLDETVLLAQTDYNLKKKYDFKQIAIIKEYEENLPMVQCEGSKIQQVFLNLFRNGAEAMGEFGTFDGSLMTFKLRLKNIDNYLQIEIEDNGPGMNEITRKRIFEPFFTTKSVGQGTGLGLSVSYFIIVENHGGLMNVESEVNKGTKFIIKLKKT